MIDNISEHILFDLDENTDYSDIYKEAYEKTAKWTMEYMNNKTAHKEYLYPNDEGTWYIPTKIHTFPQMVDEIKRLFPNKIFINGLDAGCGTTTFFEFMKIENPVLVDISTIYCEYMKKRGFKTVINNDIVCLEQIPDKYFDIIVCSDIFEHVLSFNTTEYEVRRLLKDDGVLCVNVPWNQDLSKYKFKLSDFKHVREFNNGNLSKLFNKWNILSCSELKDGDKYKWIRTCNIIMVKK